MELFRANPASHLGTIFSSTLASSVAVSGTSLALSTGDGALLPTPSGPNYFWLCLGAPGAYENVKVTSRSGDTLTCNPITNSSGWPAGTPIIWTITGETMEAAISGASRFPDAPPLSPSAWDDEFDSTTLDAKWTVDADDGFQTTGYFASTSHDVDTTWPSCYQALLDNTGGTNKGTSLKQTFQPANSTAFSFTTKVRGHFRGTNAGAFVTFMDAAGNNGAQVGAQYDGTSGLFTRDNYKTGGGAWAYNSTNRPVADVGALYIHVQRDASDNWNGWISPDGWSWVGMDGDTFNVPMTVDHFTVGLVLDNELVGRRLGVDWVRVNALTLP